jgi:hypothetical protein
MHVPGCDLEHRCDFFNAVEDAIVCQVGVREFAFRTRGVKLAVFALRGRELT